jgi:hypothetical protein
MVDTDRETWESIWGLFRGKAGTPWRDIALDPKDELGPIEVSVFAACARKAPEHIGRGCEDFHPRWFAWLSEELLFYMVILLECLERRGIWPWQISEIIVAQIPKSDGGRRPIGLLPALVKVWEKGQTTDSSSLEGPSLQAL